MYITTIRPVSDLSRNIGEIESLTKSGEIVEIVKNSKDYLVVMSKASYKKILGKMEMLDSLLVSEAEIRKDKSMSLVDAKYKADQDFKELLNDGTARKILHG